MTTNKSSAIISNSSPELSILIASREDNLIEVAESLKSGANVNTRDNQRRTPLMLATIGGHTHIVGALLNAQKLTDWGVKASGRGTRTVDIAALTRKLDGMPNAKRMPLDQYKAEGMRAVFVSGGRYGSQRRK